MTCLLMPVDAPQCIDDFSSTTPVIVMTYVVSVVTHVEECDLFFFFGKYCRSKPSKALIVNGQL